MPAAPVTPAAAPILATPAAGSPTPAAPPAGRVGPPPGARLGPLDPDPTIIGDEIPEGGWEIDGIIYGSDGSIWGCAGGGNWCGGPPPGMGN